MKDRLKALKTQLRQAKTDKERELIDAEINQLLAENPEQFAKDFLAISTEKVNEIEEVLLKDKLKDVANIVSFSYIAKQYFGKSRSWLHQRINGHLVNGKPATLTEEEKQTLNFALQDITKKIGSISI
ncbi:DUF5053 domain-containing protein [Capnocytophaga sp. ARDL2]|uniref:DUF5053 domain-containing protein n=1 Tax=Capnocytophaga sp. ARDL2 TaxID=3238809 RepID=UPI0035590E6D